MLTTLTKRSSRRLLGLVDSGPSAVYYAVDRKDYLDKLKSVYEKKRDK